MKLQLDNPRLKKIIVERLNKNHFMHHIGFKLTKIISGYVEGELIIKPYHSQQNNFTHGGVTATIADIVSGLASYTILDEKNHVLTAEIKISYFNPGVGKKLIAKGWVLKQGGRLHFCESEVWAVKDKEEILIAKATTTMAVVKRESIKKLK